MTEFEADQPLGEMGRQAGAAAEALEALRDRAAASAEEIETAFDRAGDSLVRSLARAASDGKVSLGELARAVLGAVNAAAGRNGGLGEALAQALGGLFGGARADGGPVSPGQAYLVGERGPEVFRPAGAGTIEGAGAPSVTVNLSLDRDAPGLLRSEAQIAQMLARAVRLGLRR